MIIAFHNFKGGVGSTTLAAHMCVLAHELGIKVAGVSVDFTQELPRWLKGSGIPSIEIDLEHGDSDADLIVMDVHSQDEPPLRPDVWVLPICDNASARNAGDVSDRLQGHLIWLGNKGFKIVEGPAHLVEDVELALPMPFSRALLQAGEELAIVWNVPTLAPSSGAWALRATLRDVLVRAFVAVGVPLPTSLIPKPLRALTAGEVLQMAESPPSPFMRAFTALVDQVRAELNDQPFKVTPDIASAVSAMAYKTVDFWFESLQDAGLELAHGQTTPQQLARSLNPDVLIAPAARLGGGTVLRFAERPDRARVTTFVRLAVASGRTDLLAVRPRTTAGASGGSPSAAN